MSDGVFEGLHHAQLAMPRGEEEAARAFYAGVLGMTEVEKPPVLAARGGAWFRAGGLELHLGVEKGFGPARKAHPGVLVADLDEVVRRLGAGGRTSPGTPTSPGSAASTRTTRSATGWSSSSPPEGRGGVRRGWSRPGRTPHRVPDCDGLGRAEPLVRW